MAEVVVAEGTADGEITTEKEDGVADTTADKNSTADKEWRLQTMRQLLLFNTLKRGAAWVSGQTAPCVVSWSFLLPSKDLFSFVLPRVVCANLMIEPSKRRLTRIHTMQADALRKRVIPDGTVLIQQVTC